MFFFARLNKTALQQQLPISTPNLSALGKIDQIAGKYTSTYISTGQSRGGRTGFQCKCAREKENIKVARVIWKWSMRDSWCKIVFYILGARFCKILEKLNLTNVLPTFFLSTWKTHWFTNCFFRNYIGDALTSCKTRGVSLVRNTFSSWTL